MLLVVNDTFLKIIFLLLAYSSLMVIFSRNLVFSLLMLAVSFLLSSIIFLMLNAELLALFIIIIYMGAIVILFLFAVMMLEYKLADITKNNMRFMYNYYIAFALIWIYLVILPINKCKIFTHSIFYYCDNSIIKSGFLFSHKVLEFIKIFLANGLITLHHLNVHVFSSRYPVVLKWYHLFGTLNFYSLLDSTNDPESYGQMIYSYYVLSFLIAGMVLLLASIGAVHLGKRFVNKKMNSSVKIKQFVNKQVSRNVLIF